MKIPVRCAVTKELRTRTHALAQELLHMGFDLTEKPVPSPKRPKVLTLAYDLLDARISSIMDWRAPATPIEQQASSLLEALLKGADLDAALAQVEDRESAGLLRDTLRAVKAQLEQDGIL